MRAVMSIQQNFIASRDNVRPLFLQSVVTKILARAKAWHKYVREMEELARLGDRELADVGMARADVRAFRRTRF